MSFYNGKFVRFPYITPDRAVMCDSTGKLVQSNGNTSQYIRGDGSLANFPSVGGGGGVPFYLNGGVTTDLPGYYELSGTANTGPAANFTRTGDGLIAQFITPVGQPNLTSVPSGNNIVQLYASMSSSGGTPQIYVELYKYDGVNFTLINTSSPVLIFNGTNMYLYTFALSITAQSLNPTDRFALKFYSQNMGGQSVTIYTQDSHLSEVISVVPSGIVSLNGLTQYAQSFATGVAGSDFNINSSGSTHTFNIPDASATKRGLLSTANWTYFNNKLSKGTKTIFCIDNGDFANGQAAIDAASAGDTIMFGVKAGGWGDLVIPAGKKLSLMGLQSRRSVFVQIGSISFAPTTGLNINENELYLESLFFNSSNPNVVSFGGTAPARVRINGCYIYSSNATTQLCNFSNSNAQSTWYIYDSILLTSNNQDLIRNSMNYGRIFYSAMDSVGVLLKNTAGASEIRECVLSTNFTGNAIEVNGGSVLCGYSQISNAGANSSGVLISTGAIFAGSYNGFSIPTGSGYCVRGTGFYVYGPTVFANSALAAYNVKVQNTLTPVPFTTTFTLAP